MSNTIDDILNNREVTSGDSNDKIKFNPNHYEELKDPKVIKQLIEKSFKYASNSTGSYITYPNGDRFIPAGDFGETKARDLVDSWNQSINELFIALNQENNVEDANGHMTLADSLNGNAEGTQTHDFLNPIPYYNKKNLSYLDSRTDPYKMNVNRMDYTDDIGSRGMTDEDFKNLRSWMEYIDLNGDGIIGVDDSIFLSELILMRDGFSDSYKTTNNSKDFLKKILNSDVYYNEPPYKDLSNTDRKKIYYKYPSDREKTLFKFNGNYYYLEINYGQQDYRIPLHVYKKGPYRDHMFDSITSLWGFIWNRFVTNEISNCPYYNLSYNPELSTLVMRAIDRFGNGRAYVTYDEMAEFLLLLKNEKNQIRLLMPQYHRRVEVEDLDKNFWVIAQLIDNLVQCTVGSNGIFSSSQKIASELSELWQNTAYQWNAISGLMGIDIGQYEDNIQTIEELIQQGNELQKKFDIKIKELRSLEEDKAIDVDWKFRDKKYPQISMIEDISFEELSLLVEYGYGEKEIKNIFKSSRVNDTVKNDKKIVSQHYTNGKYDMRGTIEKFNAYSIDNVDCSIPLSLLTINTTGTKSQCDFDYVVPPSVEYNNKSLKNYLESNVNDYFRVCGNFKVVVYDPNCYTLEQTVVEKSLEGGTVNRKVFKIYHPVTELDIEGGGEMSSEELEEAINQNIAQQLIDLKDFQDKANEIIIYLPKSNCVNGEIFLLSFNNLCLQDCISTDNWSNTSNYRFWKSTYYLPSNFSTTSDELSVNNQFNVEFKNFNILTYSLSCKKHFNVSLFNSDCGKFETQDFITQSSENVTIDNVTYTQPKISKHYSITRNSNISIYSSATDGQILGEQLLCGDTIIGGNSIYGTTSDYKNIADNQKITNIFANETTLDSILYTYEYYINTDTQRYYPSAFLYMKNNYYYFTINDILIKNSSILSDYNKINKIDLFERNSDVTKNELSGNEISLKINNNKISTSNDVIKDTMFFYNDAAAHKNPLLILSSIGKTIYSTNHINAEQIIIDGLLRPSAANQNIGMNENSNNISI